MLGKISGIVLLGGGALLSTYMTGSWWYQFGAHEAYPYIMTVMAALMWWLVYLQITDKED